MTTENTETPRKERLPPTHEIFPVNAEGKPEDKAGRRGLGHKKGSGYNFKIGDKRYVMFPVKPKAEQPAPGGGRVSALFLSSTTKGTSP